MKLMLIAIELFVATQIGLSQGQLVFANRIPDAVVAPVYGINPAAPSVRLSGNATTNGGTIDYTGAPLLRGTTYTASLWGARQEVTDENQFELLATSSFRTSVAGGGFWREPDNLVTVPFVTIGDAWFNAQVRVWDNQNATVTTWAQALVSVPAGGVGYSDVFLVSVRLPPAAPADLVGLTSFNLTVVPEPSALALGLLYATTLWLLRRQFSFIFKRA